MGINNFLFYLLILIRDAHKWQRTNINGQQEKKKLYFSCLQAFALCISVLCVIYKKVVIKPETIDYLLSSMSIMAGMFLALVVLVLEKSDKTSYEADCQNEQSKKIKLWRFYRQFVTLMSYAVLISLLEISILMGILFLGQDINLGNYQLLSIVQWNLESILLALKLFFVICMRISVIYFLFNFIFLSVNAITCIYQLIVTSMDANKPKYRENAVEDIKKAYKRNKISRWPVFGGIIVLILLFLIYVFT